MSLQGESYQDEYRHEQVMIRSQLQLTAVPTPDTPVVLCFPGTMCSPRIFDSLKFRGKSDLQLIPVSWMLSPGPWDVQTLGKRAVALIRELNLGSVYILGHSTGGAIALVAATVEPELVKGLLLSSTGANMKGHSDVHAGIRAISERWGTDLHQQFIRRCFHYTPDPDLVLNLLSYIAEVPQKAALEVLQSQAELDLRPKLRQIGMPVVIVHGRHDRARPLTHAKVLESEISCARLRVLDAGHMPMVEDPRRFREALQALVASVDDDVRR